MPEPYDVIVIGGGHNGLVTTGLLARAGQRVLVLERRSVLGGRRGHRSGLAGLPGQHWRRRRPPAGPGGH
ncbi:MAG: FAD-dependent oxidoreductase [Anaerolineales bacterium]|nr:FAD-dependent oxidoreductase [Anaerolineales bacterium]